MAKQPVKKKDVTKLSSSTEDKMASIMKFKKANKLENVKDKELEWITLPEAFYDAVKLPGIPKGFFSMVRGLPNTGKSTIKLCLIAQCQKMGILPVIYETEGNFPWDHARMCGVEFTDVYEDVEEELIDEETGVITTKMVKKVVDHEGFFLYFDQEILYNRYGKMDYAQGKELSKPNRKIAVLEDIAYSINDLLDQQGNGEDEIDCEMCFIWDSVGSLPCYRSVMSKTGNNMFDAAGCNTIFKNADEIDNVKDVLDETIADINASVSNMEDKVDGIIEECRTPLLEKIQKNINDIYDIKRDISTIKSDIVNTNDTLTSKINQVNNQLTA
jgi:hypothetical protein